jgi:membrane-associated protease RseP (regulator of RpoE activity)
MNPIDTNLTTPIIAQVLSIDDITLGKEKDKYSIRYRGKLLTESSKAFEQVASSLKPYGITPLFREEDGRDIILLISGVVKPRPSNPVINLILFILTFLSMIFAGTLYAYSGPLPEEPIGFVKIIFNNLIIGLPFAISLLAILLTHEFGHYLAARYHKTHVTLPYFIPFPFSPFGTMGAFIQLKEPPQDKRTLLDIGIAGPLAGLVVAIPVLLYGLSQSTVERIILSPGQGIQLEGNSILYLLSKYIVFGQLLPAPNSYEGVSPFIYWIRFFFTGHPVPIGGLDVIISPIAWAGWAGLLVTALNLIPAGQLDGGHISYVLFGKRVNFLLPLILGFLILLGFAWSGWWLWAALIFFLGRYHAEPLDQITPLDPRRRRLAIIGLVIFFLVFTPVPLMLSFAGG